MITGSAEAHANGDIFVSTLKGVMNYWLFRKAVKNSSFFPMLELRTEKSSDEKELEAENDTFSHHKHNKPASPGTNRVRLHQHSKGTHCHADDERG